MTLHTLTRQAADVVPHVDRPEDLARFLDPACPAVIWQRHAPPEFQSWIDTLAPDLLPDNRVVLHRSQMRSVVTEIFEIAKTPACASRAHLVEDIVALSEAFADLMRASYLRLRLNAVTTNACRKFHVDAISARLVCTYRGMGTQYGISASGAEPEHIFTVPTGAPILLRGTLAPEQPASGLRHRSPPIEGSGATRLVLVLDPVTDPEDA
ncbi:MAG: DUF1826 domain-containing protein [Roseovarius sp.]|nr:DUF1826 domain-containing protein [Roseovarius sp.]